MVEGVTLAGAFGAGVASFVSPCVLPLVPPYLAFMAGLGMDELKDAGNSAARRRVAVSALAFVLGFSTVFVALGAGASVIGSLLRQYQVILAQIAGVAIIIMGLHFLGVFRIGLLYRQMRMEVGTRGAGPVGAYGMGLAFGFGWTPCIGPVLAAILAVAGTRDTVGEGALLLAVYSAGLGVPFLIAAGFAAPFMAVMARFRRHMGLVEKVMGAALVVTGILFLTGGLATFSFWLLETFPGLGAIG